MHRNLLSVYLCLAFVLLLGCDVKSGLQLPGPVLPEGIRVIYANPSECAIVVRRSASASGASMILVESNVLYVGSSGDIVFGTRSDGAVVSGFVYYAGTGLLREFKAVSDMEKELGKLGLSMDQAVPSRRYRYNSTGD